MKIAIPPLSDKSWGLRESNSVEAMHLRRGNPRPVGCGGKIKQNVDRAHAHTECRAAFSRSVRRMSGTFAVLKFSVDQATNRLKYDVIAAIKCSLWFWDAKILEDGKIFSSSTCSRRGTRYNLIYRNEGVVTLREVHHAASAKKSGEC